MKPGCRGDGGLVRLVRGVVHERVDEFDLGAIAELILVDQNPGLGSRVLAENPMLATPSVKNRLEQIEVFWGYCDIRYMHHHSSQ